MMAAPVLGRGGVTHPFSHPLVEATGRNGDSVSTVRLHAAV